MDARFPEGTLARIDAVLCPKEARTDFIHSAVELELERRERQEPLTAPQSFRSRVDDKK
jgi:hypothetical protein